MIKLSLEGTVEEVEKSLLRIRIERAGFDSFEVFFPFCSSDVYFPSQNDVIHFNNITADEHWNLYVTADTKMMCEVQYGTDTIGEHKLSLLIKQYNLSITDMKRFYESFPKIDLSKYGLNPGKTKVLLFEYFLNKKGNNFELPLIQTARSCHYVSNQQSYKFITEFTPGTHYNSYNEYLLGFLDTNVSNFILRLDDEHYLPCQIITPNNSEVYLYINKIIIVKQYVVLSEMHPGGRNFECLVFDLNHVDVLYEPVGFRLKHYAMKKEPGHPVAQVTRIYIVNIALPSSTKTKCIERWLDIFAMPGGKWERVFLCLEDTYLTTVPLLDVGNTYILFSDKKWIPYENIEVQKCAKGVQMFKLIGQHSVFVKMNISQLPEADLKLHDLKAITTDLQMYLNKIVNFEAKISFRSEQMDFYASRAANHIKTFGTPGEKQHVLHFNPVGKLYLNNWNQKEYPIGLMQGITVAVRSVSVAKTYLKSNHFTNFRIINYPQNNVNTNNFDVSTPDPSKVYSFSGMKKNHLLNSIIFARVHFIKFLQFKVTLDSNGMLEYTAKLIGKDKKGETHFICNEMNLSPFLFKTSEIEERFYQDFKQIKYFSIYAKDKPKTLTCEESAIYDQIARFFKYRFANILYVEILCKKTNEIKQKNVWKALEISESSEFITGKAVQKPPTDNRMWKPHLKIKF